ncbi:Acyltransferase family protein [compost metagenome]
MTTPKTPTGSRITFLDSLRAIAVLLVLWGHVFLVGVNDVNTVGIWVPDVKEFGFGPTTPQDNIHSTLALLFDVRYGLNVGGIGVALFFLISGFVILRTIDRTKPIPFMVQRFFRIIPTCLFCVTLVAGLTYAYCSAKGLTQPNSVEGVIASAFAANYFNSSFSTIPVLWTLEIEMTFYIVMAVAAAVFKRLGYKELILVSILSLAFVAAYSFPIREATSKPDVIRHFSVIFINICYMMIGAVIYRAWEQKDKIKGVLLTLFAIAIYVIAFKSYFKATHMGIGANLPSAAFAFGLFVIGMVAGMQSRFFAPLRWVAGISYPLYLLHIPIAWGLLYFFASIGLGITAAASLASAVVILMAWATHHFVELPSQALGKRATMLVPGFGKTESA